MNFRELNEYLEKSFEHKSIKGRVSVIPSSCALLDESVVNEGMWFLDINDIYRDVCKKYPYFDKLNSIVNRMIRRTRIDMDLFKYEGKCRDAHFPLEGSLYKNGRVKSRLGYTDTIKDVPVYGHSMGHLFEHVLSYKKERTTDSYDDELILQNVLPIVMEKLMLEEFNNKGLSDYYNKFRLARLKKMCMVDGLVRNVDGYISHETLIDLLDYDVAVSYDDVEDYCAEIEMGNDPVYKAYCYYMADIVATKMVERRNFKKDIQELLKTRSVDSFQEILGQPVIKR